MQGSQRLKELGLNPKVITFISPNRNYYSLYFSANASYDEGTDSFRLLQNTGTYGGRGAHWVKAKNLVKYWKQEGEM